MALKDEFHEGAGVARDVFNDFAIALLLLAEDVLKWSVHVPNIMSVSVPHSGDAFDKSDLIRSEQAQPFR
ncbi:hypothetical protein IVA96_20565 [Bradyrhizobium sp. 159]|uniref:hypothetical protein n=1 Tax=unclassified Bradyrhizobium TaxID=2631580 RepID=UPI001FFB6C1E|nr:MULTISPECIES: hypothetical protein [unclassified Bradyrhizobium]MCK1618975.1 hypothetical protein [Bradyrhizobium sp. 159]MCK1663553.1 hypothetical protein [Bradyrhizobium sp. 153]